MISPILDTYTPSAINQATAVASQRVGSTTGAATTQGAGTGTIASDTVQISISAQALSLYEQGQTLEQIAFKLGIDIETLRRMLGISSALTTTVAQSATQATNQLFGQGLYNSRGFMA